MPSHLYAVPQVRIGDQAAVNTKFCTWHFRVVLRTGLIIPERRSHTAINWLILVLMTSCVLADLEDGVYLAS